MNKPKIHKCEECGESFRYGISLRQHLKVTGHKNPEAEESSLSENVDKLKELLEVAPNQADPDWKLALEQITKSLALKQMQVNSTELKLAPEFTGHLQDVWESLYSGHLTQSYASNIDHGLGSALGYKMADWIWEQVRPTLKNKKSESYTNLCLSIKPGEEEFFRGVMEKAFQNFALETGVLPPGINFREGTERNLYWNDVKLLSLESPEEELLIDELTRCLVEHASRLLCVKQVDARLTALFGRYPELQRAYRDANLKLMTTVGVFRELLDAGENLKELPILVELLAKHELRYCRADLVEAIQRDLGALGLSCGAAIHKPCSMEDSLFVDDVSIEVGKGILSLVDPKHGATLLERVKSVRRALSLELGIFVPGVRFRDNLQLEPKEMRILIREVEVYRFQLELGCFMLVGPAHKVRKLRGIAGTEPVTGMPILWADPEGRKTYEQLGCMVFMPETVAGMALAEAVRKNAHKIFSTQHFRAKLDVLKKTEPSLVKFFEPGTAITKLSKSVMCRLLEERVSIRKIVTILETLLEQEEDERSPHFSTELVRMVLRQSICQQHTLQDGSFCGLTLSTETETLCRNGLKRNEKKAWFEFLPADRKRLQVAMNQTIEFAQEEGYPQVLIVEADLRRPLFEFFRDTIPNLVVLSKAEVALVPEVTILAEVYERKAIRRDVRHQKLIRSYSRRRVKPTRMYKRKRP